MIYDNILGTIGRTPIVRINRLAPAGTTMYVKCEFFNPLSSVKDRLAILSLHSAARDLLCRTKTVICSARADSPQDLARCARQLARLAGAPHFGGLDEPPRKA